LAGEIARLTQQLLFVSIEVLISPGGASFDPRLSGPSSSVLAQVPRMLTV